MMRIFSSVFFCAALLPLFVNAAPTSTISTFQGQSLNPAETSFEWPKSAKKDSRGIVVSFLSAKCPCSNSHVKELKALATDYPEFEFVAVHSNPDEDLELTKKYFTQIALPFPVLQDEKTALADQFRALKTPHTFVVLKNGDIAYQGGVSSSKDFDRATEKFLRAALEDLRQGREVAIKEGRTLGCVISRGEPHVWR